MAEARMLFNENPLGPNPVVVEAVISSAANLHEYGSETELKELIAEKLALNSNMVLLGNGAMELLDTVAKCCLGPGRIAITPQFSFPVYFQLNRQYKAEQITSSVDHRFNPVDGLAEAIAEHPPDVIWLANPNNPTGQLIDIAAIDRLLSLTEDRTVTVLDEAYMDFVEFNRDASLELLKRHQKLLICRTFSKAHGIAGLRIGFMLGQPDLIDELGQTRAPMSVSGLAIAAAKAALSDDTYVERTRQFVKDQRLAISMGLASLGIQTVAGECNFVIFKMPGAFRVVKLLEARGILVRELSDFGMPGFIRASISSAEDNQKLIDELSNISTDREVVVA